MELSHFPSWGLCFHFKALVAMEDFKASSKGACFGAERKKAFKAENTVAKEFFDVQA